jgi:hypothetical protein
VIERVRALLAERLAPFGGVTAGQVMERDAPGGLALPGLMSANRHCRLLRAADGWIALNLAREEDRDLIPALVGGEVSGDPWAAAAEHASRASAAALVSGASELHLPLSRLGERAGAPLAPVAAASLEGVRVLDLSALWAGPLAAALLARAGAAVTRVQSVTRPDPTPLASPALDAFLNAAKHRITLDFRDRDALRALLADADVVVTSGRPAALARLGLVPAEHPHRIWLAVTAHGWQAHPDRVGFGDDCAVAGALVRWERGEPRFLGDALADPLTGVEGALAVMRAIASGAAGLLDVSLAGTAASYARGTHE